MRISKSRAFALVALALGRSSHAQTVLFDSPVDIWVQSFRPMGENNGLVWAPDDLLLYATSLDGALAAMNPDNGTIIWTFEPTGNGTVPFSCNGEVSFANDTSSVIYAVTEGESCKVYALSHPYGDLLWTSPALEGSCEGTPYYTSDGAYVFVTHNSNGETVGHFSVIDTAAGSVFYTFTQDDPFGPFALSRDVFPGGNYGAGVGNANDLAMWGYRPSPTATSGEQGSVFAFQLPPPTSLAGAAVTTLLATTSWRHAAPPLLAARGQQSYWMTSRSQVRAWINARFTAGADGEAQFSRGDPSFRSAPYTPAADNTLSPTIMCGGPANPEFACLSTVNVVNGTMELLWSVSTGTGLVSGDPLMSTGGDRVYWTDTAGTITAADPSNGAVGWTSATGVVIEANPELSSDGARFFFADNSGAVVAWEVAEGTLPPVVLPPREPTAPMPAMAPSGAGTTPVVPDSLAPSIVTDTSMPSPSPMPVLTASPVSRPATSGLSTSVTLCWLVSVGIVSAIILL